MEEGNMYIDLKNWKDSMDTVCQCNFELNSENKMFKSRILELEKLLNQESLKVNRLKTQLEYTREKLFEYENKA